MTAFLFAAKRLLSNQYVQMVLIALTVAAFAIHVHNTRVDAAIEAYAHNRDKQDADALREAQQRATLASTQNARTSDDIDITTWKELQHAQTNLNQLRADINNGVVRLRTNTRDCNQHTANPDTASSMGHGSAPDNAGSRSTVEQDILAIAGMTQVCIAQRDYLKAKHAADIDTLTSSAKESP